MANIETLVDDIYKRIDSSEPFDATDVDAFAHMLARKLYSRLVEERGATTLRLSNWDAKCERQLWLKINMPHLVEGLPPNVKLKFLYGDVLEELLMFLARAAGHNVEGEQDTLSVGGVEGHRDGIIDGRTVDAKSASPFGFRKFEDHSLRSDDAFGYIGQLGSYVAGGADDPRVTDKHTGSFLAIDKVSGKLALDTYEYPPSNIAGDIDAKRQMLKGPMPRRAYDDEPDGKSGNRKLGMACGYCPVKSVCWNDLRAFAYANGPRYLTHVEKLPDVPEFDPKREGAVGAD